MSIIKKLLYMLTPFERKRAFLLLMLILIMATLEMIGVASILPFISVLTNPNLIETNYILNSMFTYFSVFGVENHQQFLIALGIIVFILLLTSLTIKVITIYFQIRFIQLVQHSISKRLIEIYLSQPYSWFLNHHSADFGKKILHEIGMVMGSGIGPLIELVARSAVTITILSLLIITNPKLTLIVGFTLGFSYFAIFKLSKSYISRLGEERLKSNEKRFISISEAFGAIKEIKIGGLEQTYVNRFSNPNLSMAKNLASSATIESLPRFFVEAVSFGGIILLILYLMILTGNFNEILPIISLYAFAGYRLIPSLQVIYSSFTKFNYAGPSVDQIFNDLMNLNKIPLSKNNNNLDLKKEIYLNNISYDYPESSKTALKNISLKIDLNTTVGFVGSTGSGKTTTADIILGLLEAQKGSLEVDGKIITKENSRNWQKSIGYVPQFIFLSDDSISANIAFGIEPKNIDQEAVEKAAKIANLHEFVINELPNKYQSTIGERGVRLSGGQRQRIGIARALYNSPKVLILDEATNALDMQTEQAVMDAVNNLNKSMTIILIAHRLNTLKKCNKIYMFDKGEIKSECSYEQMINLRENFDIKDKIKKSV